MDDADLLVIESGIQWLGRRLRVKVCFRCEGCVVEGTIAYISSVVVLT